MPFVRVMIKSKVISFEPSVKHENGFLRKGRFFSDVFGEDVHGKGCKSCLI